MRKAHKRAPENKKALEQRVPGPWLAFSIFSGQTSPGTLKGNNTKTKSQTRSHRASKRLRIGSWETFRNRSSLNSKGSRALIEETGSLQIAAALLRSPSAAAKRAAPVYHVSRITSFARLPPRNGTGKGPSRALARRATLARPRYPHHKRALSGIQAESTPNPANFSRRTARCPMHALTRSSVIPKHQRDLTPNRRRSRNSIRR